MKKSLVVYRGSLKSCNYKCFYCPFSKRKMSDKELEKDKSDLDKFCKNLARLIDKINLGAIFITPYGEAMIHNYYIESLAYISNFGQIDKVGIQTNLSFDVEKMCNLYKKHKGMYEKLCIWATFHPDMTNVDTFAKKVIYLKNVGINISVGVVGVPENIDIIKDIRKKLPYNIYLWINKMDGLKRKYTDDEKETFLKIDPLFKYELNYRKSNVNMCTNRYFVESNGNYKICNISKSVLGNIYDENDSFINTDNRICKNKICSCFLAYGGRKDFDGADFFIDYPIFRIAKE